MGGGDLELSSPRDSNQKNTKKNITQAKNSNEVTTKLFKCTFPGCTHRKFQSHSGQQNHYNSKHNNRPKRKCPLCPQECHQKQHLHTHFLTHKDNPLTHIVEENDTTYLCYQDIKVELKTYTCVCGKDIKRHSDYLDHIKRCLSHVTPEEKELNKSHKCEYTGCNYATDKIGNLTAHMRTHSGERPYACSVPGCSKAFARSDALRYHTKSLHGDNNDIQEHHEVVTSYQKRTDTNTAAAALLSLYKSSMPSILGKRKPEDKERENETQDTNKRPPMTILDLLNPATE